jgi:hypothetical protein
MRILDVLTTARRPRSAGPSIRRGMFGHVEVQDAPPMMAEHDQGEEERQ